MSMNKTCWLKVSSFVFLFSLLSLLTACSSTATNFAPVTDGWQNSTDASSFYRVQPDDTLYSIAFRYGLDYRALAAANHIDPPYRIEQGQKLQLSGANGVLPAPANAPSQTVVTGSAPATVIPAPVATTSAAPAVTKVTTPTANTAPTAVVSKPVHISTALDHKAVTQWLWPAKGKVIRGFSNAYAGTRGIDIAGKMGDPVRATAAGQVVYCGSGLRGYGLLIIIKHNAEFLSAYAHNSKALVAEGDMVKAGQKIALMGNSEAPQVILHFEIRREGQPVNPLSYLPPR